MISGWHGLEDRVREALRPAMVATVVAAYDQVVARSPVRTGAYRTEHVIGTGDDAVTTLLYEADNRVGPDTIVKESGEVLEPPSISDAERSLDRIDPFASVTILNDRFYADRIENGSSQQAPQGVYQIAADAIEGLVLNDAVVIE